MPPQQPRIAVGEEVPQAAKPELPPGVDEVMRAAHQPVQILLEIARRAVGPRSAQVGGGLPVKQPEIAQVVAAQRLHAVGFHPPG